MSRDLAVPLRAPVLGLVLLLCNASGCMVASTQHTARPMAKGRTQITFANGTLGAWAPAIPADKLPSFGTIEIGVRHGIHERMDFGARLYLAGLYTDLNIKLVERGQFVLSVNPGIGGGYAGDDMDQWRSIWSVQGWIPILMDLVTLERFILTVGPKFGMQGNFTSATEEIPADNRFTWLVGGLVAGQFNISHWLSVQVEFSAYYLEGGVFIYHPVITTGFHFGGMK